MSGIALREAHNAHNSKIKKRKPVHLGKIHYVVGYDVHYEIYGVNKEYPKAG